MHLLMAFVRLHKILKLLRTNRGVVDFVVRARFFLRGCSSPPLAPLGGAGSSFLLVIGPLSSDGSLRSSGPKAPKEFPLESVWKAGFTRERMRGRNMGNGRGGKGVCGRRPDAPMSRFQVLGRPLSKAAGLVNPGRWVWFLQGSGTRQSSRVSVPFRNLIVRELQALCRDHR